MSYDNTPNRLESAFIQRDNTNTYYEQVNLSGSNLVIYHDENGILTADNVYVWATHYGIGSGGQSLSSSWASASVQAQYATQSLFATQSVSASYAGTASYLLGGAGNSESSSWASASLQAQYTTQSLYATQSISSSHALTASYLLDYAPTVSASWASASIQSQYATQSISASYITASNIVGNPLSASYALTASHAFFAYASQSITASYALSSGTASLVINPNVSIDSFGNASLTSYVSIGGSSNAGKLIVLNTGGDVVIMSGSISASNYYGRLMGRADTAISASWASASISSSYALFTSTASGSISSSYAFYAATTTGSGIIGTLAFAYACNTASLARTASYITASNISGRVPTALTASNADTASYAFQAANSFTAVSASYAPVTDEITNAQTASMALSINFVPSASLSASWASSSLDAKNAETAQTAQMATSVNIPYGNTIYFDDGVGDGIVLRSIGENIVLTSPNWSWNDLMEQGLSINNDGVHASMFIGTASCAVTSSYLNPNTQLLKVGTVDLINKQLLFDGTSTIECHDGQYFRLQSEEMSDPLFVGIVGENVGFHGNLFGTASYAESASYAERSNDFTASHILTTELIATKLSVGAGLLETEGIFSGPIEAYSLTVNGTTPQQGEIQANNIIAPNITASGLRVNTTILAPSITASLRGTASCAVTASNAITAAYLLGSNQHLSIGSLQVGDISLNGSSTIADVGGEYITLAPETATAVHIGLKDGFDGVHANLNGTASMAKTSSYINSVVPIEKGGTNNTAYNTHGLIYYDGTRLTTNTSASLIGAELHVSGSVRVEGKLDVNRFLWSEQEQYSRILYPFSMAAGAGASSVNCEGITSVSFRPAATTANTYCFATLARSITGAPGYSGVGINFNNNIIRLYCQFTQNVIDVNGVMRWTIGTGSRAPGDSPALNSPGFGLELRGSTKKAHIFAHNGTTYVTSSGVAYNSNPYTMYYGFILEADGAGRVNLYWNEALNTQPTIPLTAAQTLIGAPIGSGIGANSYINAYVVTNAGQQVVPDLAKATILQSKLQVIKS